MRARPFSRFVGVALAVLALDALAALAASDVATPPATWLLDQVKILSAADMEGRASGTPGGERAARHIATVFRDVGLAPSGDGGGYLQSFSVPTGIRLGDHNMLGIAASPPRALTIGQDWTPLAVSSDGNVDAEVVFAGYGITAPDLRWDDYADVDARGKVVVAFMREPRPSDPASPFRKPDAYHFSERSHKILNAREHGARGILLVAHPLSDRDELPALTGITQPSGILAAAVTRDAATRLVRSTGQDLRGLASAIDGPFAPHSIALPGVRVKLAVRLVREHGTTANVVALLRGTDRTLRDEAIVVGAHYDHLGRGGEGSLAPDQVGAIHHGADDNASGTTVVMALAKAFAASGGLPRTLVFAAFSGEEMGLLGSAEYVKRPAVPLDRTVLMLNLDMVGRLRDTLYVSGVDSGTGLRALVEASARALGVPVELRGDPFARSDHTTFYASRRPVLFFFTGAHPDYHRPSDTWDRVNIGGLATVTSLAARVVTAVATTPAPPAYVRIEGGAPARDRGNYGPFFGVVPEFSERKEPGVKVAGVRPGSPAEKAGVRQGDVIVRFAGVTVKTLDDFTFALRGRRAGDRVDVTVVRDGHEQEVAATLEERR
jgi:aminopeptidase YwaD